MVMASGWVSGFWWWQVDGCVVVVDFGSRWWWLKFYGFLLGGL